MSDEFKAKFTEVQIPGGRKAIIQINGPNGVWHGLFCTLLVLAKDNPEAKAGAVADLFDIYGEFLDGLIKGHY